MRLESIWCIFLLLNLAILLGVVIDFRVGSSRVTSKSRKKFKFWKTPPNYYKNNSGIRRSDLLQMGATWMNEILSDSSEGVSVPYNIRNDMEEIMDELPISPCDILPIAKLGLIPVIAMSALAVKFALVVGVVGLAIVAPILKFLLVLAGIAIKTKKVLALKPVIVATTIKPCIFTVIDGRNGMLEGPRVDIPVIMGECFTLPQEYWVAERHGYNNYGKCFIVYNGEGCTGLSATLPPSQGDQTLPAPFIDAFRSVRTC